METTLTSPPPKRFLHPSAVHAPPGRVGSFGTSNGRLGMWMFLASEILTFGGVVAAYVLLRLAHPEWMRQSSETLLPIGAINTLVLLTSSLTMVLAHNAAESHQPRAAKKFLLLTVALGVLFLAFKAFEYHHEFAHGRVPTAAPFWGFYYCMTGLHALHVIAGLVAMLWLFVSIKPDPLDARLQTTTPLGLYWHFVDIVWIFLFPLLYVTTQQ